MSKLNNEIDLSFRLKMIGTYGLKNKREVWRIQLTLAKMR